VFEKSEKIVSSLTDNAPPISRSRDLDPRSSPASVAVLSLGKLKGIAPMYAIDAIDAIDRRVSMTRNDCSCSFSRGSQRRLKSFMSQGEETGRQVDEILRPKVNSSSPS